MIRNRYHRFITVLFALMSLLFMQLAVAGYACPGKADKLARAAVVAEMATAGMPCAESMALTMDEEQPSLCQAHCKADQQSTDKYQVPGLAALDDLATALPSPRIAPVPLGAPLQAPLLRRTTAPPLAVRHCCFRL